MRILVTGANGQLGKAFEEKSKLFKEYVFFFKSSSELDITNQQVLASFFESYQIDYLINCAAYTNVDGAENDRVNAFKVNAEAVENLAVLAKKYDFGLIHFSTDYVFDGESTVPYVEEDVVNPVNVYGASKLAGEQAILNVAPKNSVIFRVSWLYGKHGKNFVKTILDKSVELDKLNVVNDQFGVLTNAEELAETVLKILPKIQNTTPEIYHYSGSGITTWFEISKEICDLTHRKCKVISVSSDFYKTIAKRPKFSKLNSTKFEKEFGVKIPDWKITLWEYLKGFKN